MAMRRPRSDRGGVAECCCVAHPAGPLLRRHHVGHRPRFASWIMIHPRRRVCQRNVCRMQSRLRHRFVDSLPASRFLSEFVRWQQFDLLAVRAGEIPPLESRDLSSIDAVGWTCIRVASDIPQPLVEANLDWKSGRESARSGARLQVDYAHRAIPALHHVQFSSRPAVGVKLPLRFSNTGILHPRARHLPSFPQ